MGEGACGTHCAKCAAEQIYAALPRSGDMYPGVPARVTEAVVVEVHELAKREEGTQAIYVALCTVMGGGRVTTQRVWLWASLWQGKEVAAPTLGMAAKFVARQLVQEQARGVPFEDFARLAPVLQFPQAGVRP